MKKDQVDLENKVVRIPDSKTPNGVGEVPLTDLAVEAIRDQMQLAGNSPYLFPRENAVGHQTTFKTAWRATLRRAKVPYFRIYDLRSTYATRLSAGGVADEWVTQLLRQGHCEGLQEVLADEVADETRGAAEAESRRERVRGRFGTGRMIFRGFGTVLRQFSPGRRRMRTSTLPETGVESTIFKDGM